MRIQHNIPAMSSYRNYTKNTGALAKNLEKLSSGYRINRAGDDAAGLAISEKMRAQITGLNAAQKNVKDGTSLVKTAEGAMQEIHDMLNRMDYLATQSANGTYDNEVDRLNLQKEVQSLKEEINRIADSANFNGIKLLDGSQSSMNLSAEGVTYSTKSLVEGLKVNDGVNGGGTKSTAEIDVSSLFGTGDTMDIKFSDTNLGTAGTKTLTFGTDITGTTKEEQAASIAKALSGDANISQKFDVSVDGTKVTLTNKEEGSDKAYVDEITVNDAKIDLGTKDGAASKPGAAGATGMTAAGWETLFASGVNGNGADVKAGDVLRFNFKGANGETLTAEVAVTDKMIGADIETTTANIVAELNKATFLDNDATVADESKFAVKDFFTATANKDKAGAAKSGGIQVEAAAGVKGKFELGDVEIKRTGDTAFTAIAASGKTSVAGSSANADPKNIYATTGATGNFSAGDKFNVSGTLSDGRSFNIALEAGKDFEIKGTLSDTLTEITTKLGSSDLKVTLTGGEVVGADEIFGAGKEITVAKNGTGDGLVFTSTKDGLLAKGFAGGVTNVYVEGTPAASVKSTIAKGTDPSAAESSFTFEDGVGYGTAITIGGKTYELVADARDVTNRSNEAVVVSDLTDLDAVAKGFADAINSVANNNKDADGNPPYTAAADGATVKVTTTAKGSDVKAMEITTPYGDEAPTVSFKFDPNKIQAGSYMTISDGKTTNTYEFVKAGEKPKSGNTAIEISDFNKMPDAKALGEAFANVAKGATVEVADDGTVTITANEVDGSIPKLNVNFYEGKGGLKLQIGDTSEEYNQLKVSVGDMHTVAMGINDIDISNQEGAAAAIDVIKNAINYVSGVRGDLGAIQNRLDHTSNNLSVMAENIQDAESTIRDTDVAEEMMSYVKNNILVQSAQAMLAQANQLPQGVLQLLG